jgi:hypothetical protein
MAPLDTGGAYAVGISSALRDVEGAPFESPDAFVALRDGIATDDARVEGARDRFEAVFDALDGAGLPRDELLVAWEIPVASEAQVLGPIRSMRAQAEVENASGVPYTIESVETDPSDHAWKVVRGCRLWASPRTGSGCRAVTSSSASARWSPISPTSNW